MRESLHARVDVIFFLACTQLSSFYPPIGLSNLRYLICRSTITITPALSSAVQSLRLKFNECVSRYDLFAV